MKATAYCSGGMYRRADLNEGERYRTVEASPGVDSAYQATILVSVHNPILPNGIPILQCLEWHLLVYEPCSAE